MAGRIGKFYQFSASEAIKVILLLKPSFSPSNNRRATWSYSRVTFCCKGRSWEEAPAIKV